MGRVMGLTQSTPQHHTDTRGTLRAPRAYKDLLKLSPLPLPQLPADVWKNSQAGPEPGWLPPHEGSWCQQRGQCSHSRPQKAASTRHCWSHRSFHYHSSAQTAARGIPTPIIQGSVIPHLAGKDAGNPGACWPPAAAQQGGAPGALCTLEARGEGDSITHASCNHCTSALLPRCTPPSKRRRGGTWHLPAPHVPRGTPRAASTAWRGRVPRPRGRPCHSAAPPAPARTTGRQGPRAALLDAGISN